MVEIDASVLLTLNRMPKSSELVYIFFPKETTFH